MNIKSKIFIILTLLSTTISYASIDKPQTREEFEQKVEQQRQKIHSLQEKLSKQNKELIELRKTIIDLRSQVFNVKYGSEPNGLPELGIQKKENQELQTVIKGLQAEIARLKKLFWNAGIDPNSDPNNIKKLMTEQEKKEYQARLDNYRNFHKYSKKDKPKPPSYKYEIVQRNDLSFGGIVRTEFRVRINKPVTKDKIRVICNGIIRQQKKLKPHNAIAFFFYLPDSDISGHYTAGKADWAPYGRWEQANSVATGDYSKHKLVLQVGNALGTVPKSVKTDLPLSKRKKIFYDLVVAQDRGVGDVQAYSLIAKKYRVDVSVVKKIGVEGAINGWPMPPLP